MGRIDDSLYEYLASLPMETVEEYVEQARLVRCWYLYPPPEISWLGNWESRRELEELEKRIAALGEGEEALRHHTMTKQFIWDEVRFNPI